MKIKLLYILLLLSLTASSQKEANIWYFGYNAGLDFNSGIPVALTDGQLKTEEGCATLSNSSGDLLFYTDGITVYNRNHKIMPNGTGLLGHPSSSQSATIVSKPGFANLFYIFTIDYESNPNGFRYSVIDLSLDGGLGGVTSEKNVPVYQPTLENIAVTKHSNGVDSWIITHGWNNNSFNAYLLTSSGLSAVPVTTNIGAVISGIGFQEAGYMKIAPSGSKLAFTSVSDIVQLFNFNNATGVLSNPITLLTEFGELYGVEFSTNENVLYVSNAFNKLYQFNLTANDIPSSKIILYNGSKFLGALQIGPDKKIYLAVIGQNKLGVINNPDVIGIDCNFQIDAIDLLGKLSQSGLPAFNQSFFFTPTIELDNYCEDQDINFKFNTNQQISSVNWNFGDGTFSNSISPIHNYSLPGNYNVSLTVTGPNGTGNNSSEITIFAKPSLKSNNVTLKQCDDDSDGFSSFNLEECNLLLVSDTTDLVFSYYKTIQDAQNKNNSILNYTSYINQIVSNDILFARVENKNGCNEIAQINLYVSTTLIPVSFHIYQNQCDDLESGSNIDGIATFNFSNATDEIRSLFPAGQLLTIRYFKNLTDALAEKNSITDISNYENVGYLNTQKIYVRVDSQINNECLGLGHHITLNVDRIPIVQPQIIRNCDDNQDGYYNFDTSNLENNLLNGLTDTSITFTDSKGNPVIFTDIFYSSSQVINIKLVNNFGAKCEYYSSIQFIVDDLPEPYLIPVSLTTFCDDETDPLLQNDSYPFDTSLYQSLILGNQIGYTVNYYDNLGNILSSPLPNPFNSGTQDIRVEIINPNNKNCTSISKIPLIVNKRPIIDLFGDELICSDNLNFIKVINAGLIDPSTANDYSYSWYRNNVLIPNEKQYTLTINTQGDYKVEVYNSNGCNANRNITVTASNKAIISSIEINDLTEQNSIEVLVTGQGEYSFSLDGFTYQKSNVFYNLLSGANTIYVKDDYGCGISTKEFNMLGIPKYFTPNGDGYNDFWNISGVNQLFNSKAVVYIFNRFGKLLNKISPINGGWNGTYNNESMPSDDYWFVLELENNRVVKGHFSLIR